MSETLTTVIRHLQKLAPLELAAPWDNVGLLLLPSRARRITRLMLTIDVTDAVAREVIAAAAQLIVAYHPPIFAPLKRLPGDSLVLLIENRIAVYSPHTALDAAAGGVNDWLGRGLGITQSAAIEPAAGAVPEGPPLGQGRFITLARPGRLPAITRRVKRHLGLRWVRVATAARHQRGVPIRSVALCAGAGASVVTRATEADLLLTGEMRHHDILAALARGTSVILTDHSHSERGYLQVLRRTLRARWRHSIDVRIARADREPLRVC